MIWQIKPSYTQSNTIVKVTIAFLCHDAEIGSFIIEFFYYRTAKICVLNLFSYDNKLLVQLQLIYQE